MHPTKEASSLFPNKPKLKCKILEEIHHLFVFLKGTGSRECQPHFCFVFKTLFGAPNEHIEKAKLFREIFRFRKDIREKRGFEKK